MLGAASLALSEIFSPAFRTVFWRSLGLTIAMLVVVWIGADAGIKALLPVMPENWAWLVDWLTGLAIAIGLGFLVAPVTALFAGLFLDEIAELVEKHHYPLDAPGRPMAFWPGLWQALRFTALILVVNAVLLVLLLLPVINVPIFFVVNAYLLGREYFEFVAYRFHDRATVERLRSEASGRLFVAGLLITFLLAVPILNLLTPLFATAFMVHVYKRVVGRSH